MTKTILVHILGFRERVWVEVWLGDNTVGHINRREVALYVKPD